MGHRKIAAMMRADGHAVSTSTVERALRRWVFRDPPTERNRVWQTDFSEFETADDDSELAWVGAGPLEDLVSHSGKAQ